MRNICLTIEYDGTRFNGWQRQDAKRKHRTVQAEVEKSAKKLFGKRIRLIGAGRTDSGVHAEAQVANFKIDSKLPLSNILHGLNHHLPKDIAVLEAREVSSEFHARYNARGKLYRYTIINRNVRSPLLERHATLVTYSLDERAMRKAAKYLIGRKDFKTFQARDRIKRNSIRTIKRLDIVKRPPLIHIFIQADGFLYNMARNIVGTLIEVGRGKIEPERIKEIISKGQRSLAGKTAPAKGLCLVRVLY